MIPDNPLDRVLEFFLIPFDATPEDVLHRLGVVPTVAASFFVQGTHRLYDYIGTQPGLGRFLNVGWWEDYEQSWEPTDEFDMTEQCARLVRKVGRRAGLDAQSDLLDVGFGYGEQDRIFRDEFNCGSITGINITKNQVRTARDRFRSLESGDRAVFHVGNAVRLPYPDEEFSHLIALESPFHFKTRERFLEEAFRVLEPGGRLVVTDIINGYKKGQAPLRDRLIAFLHNVYWQVADENHCTVGEYDDLLLQKGFTDVKLDEVTERTLVPGITRYLRWRMFHNSNWMSIPARPVVQLGLDFYRSGYLRYVLASARRPH
jgi:microcystin synthetase protein McyJ